MNNIRIGFSKPKNKLFPWFSWLIRVYENTQYSHVYIRWDVEGLQEKICYQASGLQVNFIGQKIFEEEILPVHEYSLISALSPENQKELLKFCISNSGVPYGIKQIFGIVIQKLFRLNKNPFADNSNSFVCSELIGTIFKEIFNLSPEVSLDNMLPKDVENIIMQHPKFFKKTL